MINTDFMARDFGIENPFPDDLMQVSVKFMMAFYYCEERFFHRYCQFRDAESYVTRILAGQQEDPSVQIESAFQFFRERYITNADAAERRRALVSSLPNPTPQDNTIETSFLHADGRLHSKLLASMYVIIRLRHNLFHANKYEAIHNDPDGQRVLISHAADLLGHLLKNSR